MIKCIVFWCILVSITIFICFFGSFIIDKSFQFHRKIQVKISQHLLLHHKVAFLSTLDDPVTYDPISLQQIKIFQAPLVKGKFGNARKFDSRNKDYSFLQRGGMHTLVGKNGTYSLWIKPFNTTEKQQLLHASNTSGGFKLFIEDNRLSLKFSQRSVLQTFTTPFINTNDFTHIAITFDEKELNLFLNGENKIKIAPNNGVSVAARAFQYSASLYPINGVLDDIAIFHRTLSLQEVKKISSSSKSIKNIMAPFWTCAERVAYCFANSVSATYRVIDRIIPSLQGATLLKSDIPTISLRMSKKDERHFKNQHEKSLKNGYRTKKAANFRKIHAVMGTDKIEFELALDDVYHFQNRSKRQAYLLKDKNNKLISGSGIVRIYPPELHLSLHPDAPKPIPLKANLIKLYIDDAFKGVYIFEHFDRDGSAWMAYDERLFVTTRTLYANGMPAYEDIFNPRSSSLKDYNLAIKTISSDLLFPWSIQEIKAKEKQCQRWREQLKIQSFKPALMPIRDILGENRASLYITQNLKLPKGNYKWRSTDPQILTHSGNVNRPKGNIPKFVKLYCEESSTGTVQEFNLRIMPQKQQVDTLFIYIGKSLLKTQRADFTCLRLPKNGGVPEWNIGFANENSGIKQRGNTSYIKGSRRSLSLKFNTPVNWHDTNTPARHIVLYSGYSDATRLRNKISFDAFNACKDEDTIVTAPKISFAEVFINGEYFGIYETSQRVKDFTIPKALLYKVRAKDPLLWQTASTEMLECVSIPTKTQGPHLYKPISDIFSYVATATKEDFANTISNKFHVNNVLSFFLILNLTENFDGTINNQYIAHDPIARKWYLIPWDYDKAFPYPIRGRTLTNHLLNRFNSLSNAKQKQSEIWTNLRNGALSDTNLFTRIESDFAIIKPYLTNEFQWLYPNQDKINHDGEFSKLKLTIEQALLKIDKQFLRKRDYKKTTPSN